MSGVFNPNDPSVRIRATDDEALAKRHGLTEWNDELGQYVAPRQDDHDEHPDRRERRDEDPAEHEALAAGLAPGEKPAATESDNAEPLIVSEHDEHAAPVEDEHDDDKPAAGRKRK